MGTRSGGRCLTAMRFGLVAAALLVTSSAGAWSRRDTAAEATPSVVHGKLDGETAVLRARFTLPVESETYNPGRLGVDLPLLGVVTSAIVTANGVAHPLGLLPADKAQASFDALSDPVEDPTRRGEKANAVLISGSPGRAEIGVAAARAGTLAIDLTVSAPTCFYRDARYVEVPASWREVSDPALRRVPIDAAAVSAACRANVDTSQDPDVATAWLRFATTELVKKPSGDRIGASAARLVLGDENLVRLDLAVAGKLADVPRDLATVVLVDASRSMSTAALEVQRQLVASYLRAAPASRVQVLAYARRTTPLLPGWTTAAQAAARVDRALRGMAPRNGSNFDQALADATEWLARVEGTRRIVLVTDERMGDRLAAVPPTSLRRLLPPGTLVHVIAIDAASIELQRDEDAKLASLASATDGMAVRAGPLEEPRVHDATLLVRPISLDQVTVKAPGWTTLDISEDRLHCGDDIPSRLSEGEACTWWGEGDAAAGPLVVEALVWGKRVQRVVRPDPNRGREVARELSVRGLVDDKRVERVNELARAVNGHWSLYGSWGGRAKYEFGLEVGISGGTSSCACTRSTTSFPAIGHGHPVFHQPVSLESQLRPLLATCEVEDARIRVELEMTGVEIVALTAHIEYPDVVSAAVERKRQACVEDALWDATPMLPEYPPHLTIPVELPRKR